ncbi:hypothetical protein HK097_000186, partial [Rhizophlyctis rosea]
ITTARNGSCLKARGTIRFGDQLRKIYADDIAAFEKFNAVKSNPSSNTPADSGPVPKLEKLMAPTRRYTIKAPMDSMVRAEFRDFIPWLDKNRLAP